jgi:regulator of replication initiation timing
MPNNDALIPLQRTSECLNKIRENLTPFLELLDRYHNQQKNGNGSSSSASKKKGAVKFDKQEITEAEAAVALAMGTLRYMAHRLKGNARGQKKNDPLRLELDKMRKTLVAVKKLRRDDSKKDAKKAKGASSTDTDTTASTGSGVKRRRLAEEEASSASTSSNGNDGKKKAPKKKKAKK